jgi:hypothetical protein
MGKRYLLKNDWNADDTDDAGFRGFFLVPYRMTKEKFAKTRVIRVPIQPKLVASFSVEQQSFQTKSFNIFQQNEKRKIHNPTVLRRRQQST